MKVTTEDLVELAKRGDRHALTQLVARCEDNIYGLALRILHNPYDAQDATQEILVKLVTHLSAYEGRSAFYTWVYRIAANHLLNCAKKRDEREALSFEAYANSLDTESGFEWEDGTTDPLQKLILDDIRIGCLQGLLLCLDRAHRLAFVMSEVLMLSGQHGAEVLALQPATYRKRVSRAKRKVREFLEKYCALVNSSNPCLCERYAAQRIEQGTTEEQLTFAGLPCRAKNSPQMHRKLAELKSLNRMQQLFASYPDYRIQQSLVPSIQKLIDSNRITLLSDPRP